MSRLLQSLTVVCQGLRIHQEKSLQNLERINLHVRMSEVRFDYNCLFLYRFDYFCSKTFIFRQICLILITTLAILRDS